MQNVIWKDSSFGVGRGGQFSRAGLRRCMPAALRCQGERREPVPEEPQTQRLDVGELVGLRFVLHFLFFGSRGAYRG